jgi:UPF0755 protein
MGCGAVRRFFYRFVLLLVLSAGGVAWWLQQPMALKAVSVDLSIEPGTPVRAIAREVAEAGVQVNPTLLYWWFRLSGQARQIKAGSYEIESDTSPYRLLQKLVRGEESLRAVTLVEGWTFRQFRAALAKEAFLTHDTEGLDAELIMQKLGKPLIAAEGRFFPDTYTYAKGSSELAVLRRAMRAMDKQLDAAWRQRPPGSLLQSPEQALTLASIVEKETGRASDRDQVAAVFYNRLRLGMRLQTDPTVIYGLGERFDGNLRRSDLLSDTPWNTYTRAGLPPTPIAMPGKAALHAALHPANSSALYFVARGNGSSQFSDSLEEHNRAVNKYQRGQ